MSKTANFSISHTNNFVFVDLLGEFDMQTIITCFYQIHSKIKLVQNKPWGSIVDLRDWRITDSSFYTPNTMELHLDRRNQKAECWIVDSPTQGKHMEHFSRLAGIPFQRVTQKSDAIPWLSGFELPVEQLEEFGICAVTK